MQNVTRQAEVQLVAGHDRRRHARRRRASPRPSKSRPRRRLIEKDIGDDQERRRRTRRSGAAGRPGVSRPGQADSRRAVHAGQRARPERRRQRPGQRLPVRRRQRHAAAVRHALGRALVARHRAGDDDQGRRARGRLRSLRRLLDRHGQQVRHEPLRRRGQLPVPERQHDRRRSTSGSASRYEQDRSWLDGKRRRPGPAEPALLLRLVLPAGEHAREPRQPLRRAAADTSARATRASAR